MKKKILISLLVVSFFNYIGCYSYYTLTEEEINAGRPYPDESIKLILNDESEIECDPLLKDSGDSLLYLKVVNPDRIISGTGEIINGKTKKRSGFNGTISGNMIDSTRNIIVDSDLYFVVWTKNNDRISFKEGEYLDYYPQFGTGYYVWEKNEVKKISFDNITVVQIDRFDFLRTYLLFAAVIGIPFIIWWGANGFEPITFPEE